MEYIKNSQFFIIASFFTILKLGGLTPTTLLSIIINLFLITMTERKG